MLIVFPCTAGLMVLSKPVLSMLFTGDVDLASRLLTIGGITIIFTSISTLTNGVLQGINHLEVPVRHSAIALIIHLAALYVMMDKFDMGIYGVLFSSLLFSVLMTVMNQFSIRRYIHYKQEVVRTFIIPTIASVVMGIVVFAIYRLFNLFTGNTVSTLVSVVFGMFVYMLSILKLKGIRKEELYEIPGGVLIVRIARALRIL